MQEKTRILAEIGVLSKLQAVLGLTAEEIVSLIDEDFEAILGMLCKQASD